MKCPICGSDSNEILKSKIEKSKSTKSKKLLLKCRECGTVYKDTVTEKKPVDYRIIISEHEKSQKKFIKLFSEDIIKVGDVLEAEGNLVEVTSLETKRGSRVNKSILKDIETIWAYSIDILARVGISIDFKGKILSKKVDVPRDHEFTVGDIIKIGKYVFQIKSIKTTESKIRKGKALAYDIKRIYGRPVKVNHFNYDLTLKVV